MQEYKKYTEFNKGLFTDLVIGRVVTDKPINTTQKIEAEHNNLTLMNRSTDPNYNLYRFNTCGHQQFAQPTHVRRGSISCSTCDLYKSVSAAKERGMFLINRISFLKNTVLLSCGHIRVSSLSTLSRKSAVVCQQCFDESLVEQASKIKINLISNKSCQWTFTFQSCGHEKTAHFSQIFKNNLVCQVCKENAYRQEAETQGIEYLGFCFNGEDDKSNKRRYRLSCGHERSLRMSHLRESRWECDICQESHYLKPSFVYLLKITLPIGSYAKVGYARNVESRITGYGISTGSCCIIDAIHFETGRLASQYESYLHSKYKNNNVDKRLVGKYMKNGKTECYPSKMIESFIEEFERFRNE